MKKCRDMDRVMAPTNQRFVQGGMTSRDWFSLKLLQWKSTSQVNEARTAGTTGRSVRGKGWQSTSSSGLAAGVLLRAFIAELCVSDWVVSRGLQCIVSE